MTLLEKLEEAKADLKAKTENSETKAEELTDAIKSVEDIQAQIKAADEAEALIKKLETPEVTPADTEEKKMEYTNLGEFVAEQLKGKVRPKTKFNFTAPAFKAAATMTIPSSINPALVDYDKEIIGYRRPLLVADLFSTERISGNALTFFVESSSVEGGPSFTTEANKKPMMSFGDPTAKTVSLAKIASYMKESDELIEDAPWLADAINNRGMYQHQLAVESYLLTELSGTSGLGTASLLTPDGIFKAMMTVQNNSGFAPDAIVINPTDYQNIRLRKDANGQYYGGGFITAPYGNGALIEQPSIWGLRTVVTSAVSVGTCYVGACKAGASIVRKNNGVIVDIANQNEDDFLYNLVTILIEERLALAVRRPAAFVKITGQSTSTEA